MKTKSIKKYSGFQKLMIVIIPLIVMLLIASLVTLGAMYFTHNFGGFGLLSPGNIVIIMALCAAVLAIVGVIFSFITVGREPDNDEDNISK
ncbi:MAG: hypothetical protein IJT79_03450 [Ruminococcus sp.]|nr:hypothetical protein [Ruminococcus sp.]